LTHTCPGCGVENPSTNRFCISCGRALADQTSDPNSAQAFVLPDARKVCTGCHTINEPAASYCYRCGLKLPDQLYGRGEALGNPGGFWIRVAAFLLDQVLLVVASVLLVATFPGFDLEKVFMELIGENVEWTTTITNLLLTIAYYTLAVGRWGQTVGKAVLGLKVTRLDGSRLTYRRSFVRYCAYYVSAIPVGLGFFAIALSSQKRGWHDFICDTRVVNLRS